MKMSYIVRHAAGYVAGAGVFLMGIPYGLWRLSRVEYSLFHVSIVPFLQVRVGVSVFLGLTGIVFMAWSNIVLFVQGKGGPADIAGIAVSPRTKRLVVRGPYAYSRNPMVFGAFCIYLSIGAFLDSLWCVVIVMLFFFVMRCYITAVEEKRLVKDFGSEYEDYRNKTPMIVPLPTGSFHEKKT